MSNRIGNWELIDHYATGGVAEIYRARDTRSGEVVIIKRIRPDLEFDPEKHAGFYRELQLALLCTHKNLIRGIAKGTQNGADFGVLEYVDGPDLAAVLERAKRAGLALTPEVASWLVSEVLDGIDFAYRLTDGAGRELGLVHRDLTPRNIFVRYDGQVRVGDFGSSLASKQEPAEAVVGTPGYLSPEQAQLQPIDHRSDVYAIGLLLQELLTGEPAFDLSNKWTGKKNDAALLKAHQKNQRRPLPPTVPDDLRLVIEIATALDPADRYQSAREMKKGLLRSEHPPRPESAAELSALVRRLFAAELRASRIPGLASFA
ncbi:MAG: serine/threonine protein kinase [Deltaproteobacteria bacterium]|nr:serine/threonine protein kinase [Deltaproteobacteria bacterium]